MQLFCQCRPFGNAGTNLSDEAFRSGARFFRKCVRQDGFPLRDGGDVLESAAAGGDDGGGGVVGFHVEDFLEGEGDGFLPDFAYLCKL